MSTDAGRRAVIYARRSTEEQGASLERQLDECNRFAEARSWTVVEDFTDTASGWKAQRRPQFEAMLSAAERGEFDILVVWEVSRLSRRDGDDSALATIWRLRKHGIEVHSVIEPSTGVALADDITLLIKGHAAKEESDTKSARVRSGKRRGLMNGVHQGRSAPYGYDAGTKTLIDGWPRPIKMYRVDPVAGRVVEDIFRLYVDGRLSPQQIAHHLDARGIRPPWPDRPNPLKRTGEPIWHQSTIKDLLRNPALAGWAVTGKRRVKPCGCADPLDDGTWIMWDACDHDWVRSLNMPGIVSCDLWERAQAVRAERARPHMRGRGQHAGNERFLLCGLLRCGRCGERVTTRRAQRDTDVDRYICQGRRTGRCDLPRVPSAEVDDAVRRSFVEQFVDQIDTQATITARRDQLLSMRSAEASLLVERIESIEREVASAQSLSVRARSDYESGALTASQWSRVDTDCEKRTSEGEANLADLRSDLAEIEQALRPAEIDALLDQLASIGRILSGHLTADDTPLLNAQLATVFDHFVLTVDGQRTILDPELKAEWIPEGDWTTIDFGDPGQAGVEVVDYLAPVMRRVDLVGNFP
jgi:DNA invertase Pin-like site-specific DNA recombinase